MLSLPDWAVRGLNRAAEMIGFSTYQYSLDQTHVTRLQEESVSLASRLGPSDGSIDNLDFHTVSLFGDDSVLEDHWVGIRNKMMKGALTLSVQDSQSKLIFYTAADMQHREADDQVLAFLPFWHQVCRGVSSTFNFDSKFTTYPNSAEFD